MRDDSTGAVTVSAGGDFTTVGGQTRANIAALDGATGLATPWAPAGGNGRVLTIHPTASFIYAGGQFTSLGGATANHVARLAPDTGAADSSWNPNPDGDVRAIATGGGTLVYVGGAFATIGGQSRANLAAVDAVTGLATDWQPNPNGAVNALHLEDTTLYAGGAFFTIGQSTSVRRRPRLVALSTTASGPGTVYVTAFAPRWVGRVLDFDYDETGIVATGDNELDGEESEPVSRLAFFPRLISAPPRPPTGLTAVVTGYPWARNRESPLERTGPWRSTSTLCARSRDDAGRDADQWRRRRHRHRGDLLWRATGHVLPPPAVAECGGHITNVRRDGPDRDAHVRWRGRSAGRSLWHRRREPGHHSRGLPQPRATSPATDWKRAWRRDAAQYQVPLDADETSYAVSVGSGVYYARVRALGPCGNSVTSNEVQLAVGAGAPPSAPIDVTSTVSGSTVTIRWTPTAVGVLGYRLEAGSAPGASNAAVLTLGNVTSFVTAGVPSGIYFVRVRAGGASGAGPASEEVTVIVP